MDEQLQARNAIGVDAESEVVSFERRRLDVYADRVFHIAPLNQGAGYDIESVTVENDTQLFPRFIEVKAVSPDTRRFFWTANEVATAKRLSRWYYLYLLPTASGGAFDFSALQIVRDPIEVIFGERSRWRTIPNVFQCELPVESDESTLVE
jgi:hypothetical protein